MTEGLGHARGEVGLATSIEAGAPGEAGDGSEDEPGAVADTVTALVPASVPGEDIFVKAAAVPRVRQPSWFRRGRHSATPGGAPSAATVVP